MARQTAPVTADDVRQWAREKSWTDESGRSVGERGRLSSSLVTAYNKAHRTHPYEGGGTTPGRPAQKPAEKASRTPAQVQRIPEPMQAMQPGSDIDQQATMLVNEVIAALRAAPRKGGKEPVLVTVSAHALV